MLAGLAVSGTTAAAIAIDVAVAMPALARVAAVAVALLIAEPRWLLA
jgi:hypothetical protein